MVLAGKSTSQWEVGQNKYVNGQGSARGCYLLRDGDESSADEGNRLFSFFVLSRGVGCLGEYETY